jgi:hypothetical protein
MVRKMVIERYLKLDPERWERLKMDLKSLVRLVNSSGGEYSVQLREDYFNIYYQGSSLAMVQPNTNGTYTVSIHKKFAEGEALLKKLERYSTNKPSQNVEGKSQHVRFKIGPRNFHQFFQRSNIDSLSSKIRRVHPGEEIIFEQVLITDNPPSEEFIIIDRQVADHVKRAQIDLLALKRDSVEKPFHFQVIEVKLGRNRELRDEVGRQLSLYVSHIRRYMEDYVACYKKNYRQKRELGLFEPFGSSLPDKIDIDENKRTVEGLVYVCGYSGLAEQKIEYLRQKIQENQWDIKVQKMPELRLS